MHQGGPSASLLKILRNLLCQYYLDFSTNIFSSTYYGTILSTNVRNLKKSKKGELPLPPYDKGVSWHEDAKSVSRMKIYINLFLYSGNLCWDKN